jgi:hypothetical protein
MNVREAIHRAVLQFRRSAASSNTTQYPPSPFIVGVARSGTTLLRLMLDAHPELAIPPETGFIPAALAASRAGGKSREAFFEAIVRFETWKDLNIAAGEFRAALDEIDPFEPSCGIRTLYRLYASRHGKPRWGDKTPMYAVHLPEITAALPEARFIHIIRDGRDVALSVRPLWFAPGKEIRTLALDWRQRIEKTRELSRQVRGYFELRYEDLVRDPQRELRKICRFIELEYDPRMLLYYQTAKNRLNEVKTRYRPDGSVLISKEERLLSQRYTSMPPDGSRIHRWEQQMTDEENREFLHVAGPLLESLGYETRGQS